jgi:hypothetical protein
MYISKVADVGSAKSRMSVLTTGSASKGPRCCRCSPVDAALAAVVRNPLAESVYSAL